MVSADSDFNVLRTENPAQLGTDDDIAEWNTITYTSAFSTMSDDSDMDSAMTQGNFTMDMTDFWVDCTTVTACADKETADGMAYSEDNFDGQARGFALTQADPSTWGTSGTMPGSGEDAELMFICN